MEEKFAGKIFCNQKININDDTNEFSKHRSKPRSLNHYLRITNILLL